MGKGFLDFSDPRIIIYEAEEGGGELISFSLTERTTDHYDCHIMPTYIHSRETRDQQQSPYSLLKGLRGKNGSLQGASP